MADETWDAALVDALIGNATTTPYGIYVLPPDDAATELAREVEAQVFTEFFGNTREILDEQYRRYEPSTLFLLLMDHERRQPAGMIRVQFASSLGLKSLDDIAAVWGVPLPVLFDRTGYDRPFATSFDGTTVAVLPEYRGEGSGELVWMLLFCAVNWVAASYGMETMVGLFDEKVLASLEARTAEPFKYLDRRRPEVSELFDADGEFTITSFHRFEGLEPRRYLDSPSTVPVWVSFEENRQLIKSVDEGLYGLLFDRCRGMEAVVSFPEPERIEAIRPAAA